MKIGPRRRRALYATIALLWATGVFVWIQRIAAERGWPSADDWSGWTPRFLAVHGAVAIVFLVLFGTLATTHIRRGWRQRLNRPSGATLVAVAVVLTVSGWMLYYSGSERLRDAAIGVHDVVGLLLPVGLVAHLALARRSRSSK